MPPPSQKQRQRSIVQRRSRRSFPLTVPPVSRIPRLDAVAWQATTHLIRVFGNRAPCSGGDIVSPTVEGAVTFPAAPGSCLGARTFHICSDAARRGAPSGDREGRCKSFPFSICTMGKSEQRAWSVASVPTPCVALEIYGSLQ